MELLYLWIEDYKNIYRQGFNFSPLYDFEFKPDEPNKDGKIIEGTLTDNITKEERETKEKFYKDFFGKGISNVTAIVGENGAGKSNLLEYLFKREGSFIDLVIFEENGKIMIKYNEELQINFSLNNLNFESTGLPLNYLIYPTGFDTPLCYLSTVFDNRILNNGDRHAYGDANLERLDSNYLALAGNHAHLDTKMQLEFLNSNYKSSIPIKNIPNRLSISFVDTGSIDIYISDSEDARSLQHFEEVIENIDVPTDNIFSVRNKKRYLEEMYFKLCLLYLKFACERSDGICSIFFHILNETDIAKGGKYCFEMIQTSINTKSLKKEVTFLDDVEKLVLFIENYDIAFLDNTFIDLNSISNLNELSILFEKNIFGLFYFYWTGLSSGEMFFLTICSRIHYFLTREYEEIPKYYILIIDEGELGLHPHWQKKYFNHIVNFLNAFEGKQIQLILTSHSPFLVSDLPKENVIFLEKEDTTGLCKVSKLDSMKETFGANIHTLLTDSFFMKGGLVGEFAQTKIDEVIKLLDKSKLEKEEIEHCEMIISMIGEPIVKTMLRKLLDSKRLRKVDEHDDKIKQLEKELEQLRGLVNQKARKQ